MSCKPVPPITDKLPRSKSTVIVEESNYACLDHDCPCAMHAALEEPRTQPDNQLDNDIYCLPCDSAPVSSYVINHLTCDQLRVLWHQQLGHLHNCRMKLVSKAAIGVPELATDDELHKCRICMATRLRKANKGTDDSRHATVCNQGISIDAGFIVQSSKDSAQTHRYTGLNGETCYFTIVDHKSGTIYGETFASKAPPIEFINRWLAQYGLGRDVPDKYVHMDIGSELGSCPEVVELFEKSGYKVELTAAQSSIRTVQASDRIRPLRML